jgi:methyl-accepting chemotaxis protein
VRSLAQHTEAQTNEIKSILDELATELTPARDALRVSRNLVENTVGGVRSVGDSLERIAQLATDTDCNMKAVAEVVDELSHSIDGIFVNLKAATTSSATIAKDAAALVTANFAVSQMIEGCFAQYAKIDLDSQFHRTLGKGRELAARVAAVFEAAIDSGKCSLEDVLAYDYREIKGPDIQSLSRLFDVSRVPPEGFSPPKYSTRYDAVCDVEMQRAMDQIKASEPSLLYAIVADLNLYAPIHHAECCQDWTGNPKLDIARSRLKRFYHDKWTSTEGVRIGLGPASSNVPNRASREQFIEAGCEMQRRSGSEQQFNVKVVVRDASSVVVALHIPLFVRGHRFGAIGCGWAVTDLAASATE